jgi:methyltransferase (TIGR00027 family)
LALKSRAAARTALSVSALRAIERYTTKEQRLFDDPLAKALCGPVLGTLVAMMSPGFIREPLLRWRERLAPGVLGGLLCRVAYFDDVVRDSIAERVECVVLLGAGLDSRAYRIPGADTVRFFEVDQASVLDVKKARLRCCLGALPPHVRFVPIDFDAQDLETELAAAGYEGAARTQFVWEGVSQYISRDALEATLRYVAGTAAGNRVAFSYVVQGFIDDRAAYPEMARLWDRTCEGDDPLWRGGLDPDTLAEFLASFSLRILDEVGPEEHQARYLGSKGRRLPVMEIERLVLAEVAERDGPLKFETRLA